MSHQRLEFSVCPSLSKAPEKRTFRTGFTGLPGWERMNYRTPLAAQPSRRTRKQQHQTLRSSAVLGRAEEMPPRPPLVKPRPQRATDRGGFEERHALDEFIIRQKFFKDKRRIILSPGTFSLCLMNLFHIRRHFTFQHLSLKLQTAGDIFVALQ